MLIAAPGVFLALQLHHVRNASQHIARLVCVHGVPRGNEAPTRAEVCTAGRRQQVQQAAGIGDTVGGIVVVDGEGAQRYSSDGSGILDGGSEHHDRRGSHGKHSTAARKSCRSQGRTMQNEHASVPSEPCLMLR